MFSHTVKYLLFISAKARERKEQKGKRKAGGEKVRVIKTDVGGVGGH